VLATARVPVAAVAGPDAYRFRSPNVWGQVEARMLEALASFGRHASSGDPALRDAGRIAAQSERLRGQLAPFAEKGALALPPGYPQSKSSFPKQLAGLAAMLGAGLPLRCVALSGPGQYDTHADEPDALAQGLSVTAASLLAFQRDLEARGLADRVLTLVWSEFGRRAQENGSRGTDHGAAGAAFVLGARAGGRMVGEFPGLGTGLDENGNLRPTSDFRGLYAALLEQWLGADPDGIVPSAGTFERPQIVNEPPSASSPHVPLRHVPASEARTWPERPCPVRRSDAMCRMAPRSHSRSGHGSASEAGAGHEWTCLADAGLGTGVLLLVVAPDYTGRGDGRRARELRRGSARPAPAPHRWETHLPAPHDRPGRAVGPRLTHAAW
jgi:hypothetical protein